MQHAFDFLSSKDPILKNVIDSHGHPKIQLREQGFAAMVHIILRTTGFYSIGARHL
jgi:hypothetical protein